MSERLCYLFFVRERKMRPFPRGKQGVNGCKRSKVLSGYWLWLGETLQHLVVFGEGRPDGCRIRCDHCTWRRRTVSPLLLEVGSSSVFDAHQHLSSGGEMMQWERKGHDRGKRGRQGGGVRGRDLLQPLRRELLLPAVPLSRLLTSCTTAGRIIPPLCHVTGFALSPCDLSRSSSVPRLKQRAGEGVTHIHIYRTIRRLQIHRNLSTVYCNWHFKWCCTAARFQCKSTKKEPRHEDK